MTGRNAVLLAVGVIIALVVVGFGAFYLGQQQQAARQKGVAQQKETTVQQDFMGPYPTWLQDVPEADIPVTGLEGRLIASPHGQVVFFRAIEEVEVPPHAHGGQWGIVVTGRVHLTVDDEATTYEPGETYEIPSGAEHSVRLEAGTSVIDVFQDPDRYRPK